MEFIFSSASAQVVKALTVATEMVSEAITNTRVAVANTRDTVQPAAASAFATARNAIAPVIAAKLAKLRALADLHLVAQESKAQQAEPSLPSMENQFQNVFLSHEEKIFTQEPADEKEAAAEQEPAEPPAIQEPINTASEAYTTPYKWSSTPCTWSITEAQMAPFLTTPGTVGVVYLPSLDRNRVYRSKRSLTEAFENCAVQAESSEDNSRSREPEANTRSVRQRRTPAHLADCVVRSDLLDSDQDEE